MPAIKLKTAQKYGADNRERYDALRAVTQEINLRRVDEANFTAFTDNSTGVAQAGAYQALLLPAKYDGTTSGAAPAAGFNTAAGKLEDAMSVIVQNLNLTLTKLGLETITNNTGGTVAVANTVAALDKALTATNGATAIDHASGAAAMSVIRNNLATLVAAVNRVNVAVGQATKLDGGGGVADRVTWTLANVPAATASSTGKPSISDTAMDQFLDRAANTVKTITTELNEIYALTVGGTNALVVAVD